jgi:hypothetical protein
VNTRALQAKADYYNHIDAALKAATADKRAPNCRGFLRGSNGKVIGINLVHVPIPSALYELALAELIDEEAAQGNTVVTVVALNNDGIQTAERTFMAWPFPSLDGEDSPCGPGNSSNQFATTSKYPSNVIGPLAFHLGDAQGNPISDIIGGYGLPDGAHISGRVTFKQRSAFIDPEPEPEPATDSLTRITLALERLASHLGA